MAVLERNALDAEERNNYFVARLLQKQASRLSGQFTKLVVSDTTKLHFGLGAYLQRRISAPTPVPPFNVSNSLLAPNIRASVSVVAAIQIISFSNSRALGVIFCLL
jgi:hypothetical protein